MWLPRAVPQDLLDLRRNCWVDRRPKKLERAMTLAQAHEGEQGRCRAMVVHHWQRMAENQLAGGFIMADHD